MTSRGDASGVDTSLTAEDLVSAVPDLDRVADVSARSLFMIPGSHLSVEQVCRVADETTAEIARGAEGVVITQGTDTIEETSFLLDLLLDTDAPVVVTGAMRNPTLAGADGPANLLAALRVAAADRTRGLGVLVVLNDEIHAAAYVQKTHTSAPSAFQSPGAGRLGTVAEDDVRVMLRPARRSAVRFERRAFRPVAVVATALGDDGRILTKLRDVGYEGAVLEALGGGHVPVPVAKALGELAHTMPVVLSSRTRAGELLRGTYAFAGSETDLLRRGLIASGFLTASKARLLLGLLLGEELPREDLVQRFDEWLSR